MTKSDWKKCKLGDVISIKHGFAFKGDFFVETPTPYILVTPGNFNIGGGFKDAKLKYYNGPIPQDYILKPGDVIVTMTDLSKAGDTLGYSALVPELKGKILLHNQRIGLVLSESISISKQFIYWLMREHNYQQYIVNTASGSTVKHTSPSRIEAFEFLLPPIEEQKRIAGILGSLDDKIELLQKQNKTLEDMAKAIFKSWFVDFDIVKAKQQGRPKADIIREYHLTQELYDLFPSTSTDSPLGPIPTGWEVKKIHNLAILTMGQSPSGSTYNQNGTGLPFYQGRTDFGFRFPKKRVYCSAPTRIAEIDDILISVRAPVGDINLANEKCCIGRGVASIRSKMSDNSFLYYSMLNIKNQFDVFNTEGTVFGSINKNDLSNISILTPNLQIIKAYNKIASKYDRKIINNTKQIQTLTELRDTLLPRLISGKIKV